MAQQVKFYSTASLPASPNAGGVYFVDGGELYKGSQRFGLGRVTAATTSEALAALPSVARGDINVGFEGAKVYDGAAWQPLGGDTAALQSMWKSDISTWTAGLVQSGAGSYITGITQGDDGKVTATAGNFATDVKNAVGNGAAGSVSNGVTVSVTTTSGKVTAVEVTAPEALTWPVYSAGDNGSYIAGIGQDATGKVTAIAKAFPTFATGDADGQVKLGSTNASVNGWDTVKTDISNLQAVVDYSGTGNSVVTATTGNFTNLNVTDTATFSATTVSASSLTVNGSTVEQIADARIAAISSVTQTGASNGITVNVTTSAGSVTAVSVNASAFGNVMRFKGVVTTLPSEGNTSGDIVVIGADPAIGLVQGQEYIYDGTNWEVIGDQSTYALNAYAGGSSGVYAGVSTIPTAIDAAGAAINTLIPKVSTLETAVENLESAVTGGTSSSTVNGVSVQVVTASRSAAPEVTLTGVGTAASQNFANTLTAAGTSLPTESAVAAYVSTVVSGLDSNVSSSENNSIQVGVTQVDGKVTTVTADLVWLDASGDVIA